jgi:hypothetical protein
VAIVEAVEHPTPAVGLNWLVTGHVIDVNPAHAVRGPKYVVKKGKTPVLNAEEARARCVTPSTSARSPGCAIAP